MKSPSATDLRACFLSTARYHVWATTRLPCETTRGVPQSLPFEPTLGHVFNHATHHRGQIATAIHAMGREAPELDMVIMLQAESKESPP